CRQGAFCAGGGRLLSHQSGRARVRGHGRMLGDCGRSGRADGGGGTAMTDFFNDYGWPGLVIVLERVLLLVLLWIVTAYVLYADRKIWAAVQNRRGPNVVGPWGLLQSFADLIKFAVKEPIIPAGANKGVYLLAPVVTAVLALSAWAVIPVHKALNQDVESWVIADINVGILYIFAISSLMVYGVIMAGWSPESEHPVFAARPSASRLML